MIFEHLPPILDHLQPTEVIATAAILRAIKRKVSYYIRCINRRRAATQPVRLQIVQFDNAATTDERTLTQVASQPYLNQRVA